MRSVCPHVRRSWRGSGASARVGGGLTVRLRGCYRYVMGEFLPLFVGCSVTWRVGSAVRLVCFLRRYCVMVNAMLGSEREWLWR